MRRIVVVLLALAAGAAGLAGPARADRVGSWGDGAWSWFGDPRAVSVSGRYDETFVGWIDWYGHVTIGAYDPRFGVIRHRVLATIYHDDHSDPSIFVEPDKRLTVFWSGHNGREMNYRSTVRPEDISAWGPLQRVPSRLRGHLGFTYPNPVLLPTEHHKLYLFWRGVDWSADYATRTPSGRWSAAHRLIVVPGQRPYVKVGSNGSDTIGLAFTDGHPRNLLSSVYFAEVRHGSLWTAGGRWIERLSYDRAIRPFQADRVYNAGATKTAAWVWDTALDAHRTPVIVYATFPTNDNHAYWYARWDGHRWVNHFLTDAGPSISPGTIEFEYSGGITLDHANPSVVYLSRKVAGGWEIERWSTPNGGYSWRRYVVVPANGTYNVRPIVPRGSDRGPMRLLWMHGYYGTYTDYHTVIDYLR